MLNYFVDLYKRDKQITLLTWCYSVIAVVFLLVAGMIALINQPLGVAILIVPLIAIIALCMNIVFWALIHLAISEKSKQKTEKPASKSKK